MQQNIKSLNIFIFFPIINFPFLFVYCSLIGNVSWKAY